MAYYEDYSGLILVQDQNENVAIHTDDRDLYDVEHMIKDHRYNKRGNPLLPFHGILFSSSSKESITSIIPQTG